MRALILIPLLVLAACSGENQGWNPNYRAAATPYGDYLRTRELALTGRRAEPPRVIPVALPARAPTPAEIAGPSPVQILERAVTPPSAQPRRVQMRGAPAIDPVPPTLGSRRAVLPSERSALPSDRTVLAQPVVIAPAVPPRAVVVTTPSQPTVTPVQSRRLSTNVKPLYPRSVDVVGDCSIFSTPEAAQRTFRREGGPDRDPLGLDPDGDGYACSFRPAAVSLTR